MAKTSMVGRHGLDLLLEERILEDAGHLFVGIGEAFEPLGLDDHVGQQRVQPIAQLGAESRS